MSYVVKKIIHRYEKSLRLQFVIVDGVQRAFTQEKVKWVDDEGNTHVDWEQVGELKDGNPAEDMVDPSSGGDEWWKK